MLKFLKPHLDLVGKDSKEYLLLQDAAEEGDEIAAQVSRYLPSSSSDISSSVLREITPFIVLKKAIKANSKELISVLISLGFNNWYEAKRLAKEAKNKEMFDLFESLDPEEPEEVTPPDGFWKEVTGGEAFFARPLFK